MVSVEIKCADMPDCEELRRHVVATALMFLANKIGGGDLPLTDVCTIVSTEGDCSLLQ